MKENEPALTELMVRDRSTAEAERTVENAEGHAASLEPEKAMQHTPLLDYDQEEAVIDSDENGKGVESSEMSKDIECDGEEALTTTTVLVDRSRPSTSSRPSSVATSAPSLVEAEDESTESDWEFV